MITWEEIHGFTSPGEYDRFVKYLHGQVTSGLAEEVEVDENYGRGEIYGGRWFKDAETGSVWRLVPPDPPFKQREQEMIREFGDRSCWRLLLATVDGEHAGIGTLWLDGQTAFFANGATVPRFRGRGVHGALIRARLREAAQAGARVVYVDTNVSSVSERNLHRYGFRLVCHLGMWSRLVSIG
jgi:hypothetical protein